MNRRFSLEDTGVRVATRAFARMKKRLNFRPGTLEGELQREENDQAKLMEGAEFAAGFGAAMGKQKSDFSAIPRVISDDGK